jgi:hypothetical protein
MVYRKVPPEKSSAEVKIVKCAYLFINHGFSWFLHYPSTLSPSHSFYFSLILPKPSALGSSLVTRPLFWPSEKNLR